MAAIVVAFALALLTGVEVGSGGLATPAVGALLLMLSVNANAAGGGGRVDECNCRSGIISEYGQCWICEKSQHASIRLRTKQSREIASGLGGCKYGMNSTQLITRKNVWSVLLAARNAENACWVPSHQNHLDEAKKASNQVVKCNGILGVLSK